MKHFSNASFFPRLCLYGIVLFFMVACSSPKCKDQNEPVLGYVETSQSTGADTIMVQSICMVAGDRSVSVDNEDFSAKKIRLAPSSDQMEMYFAYTVMGNTMYDTVLLTYARAKEYTSNECGFKIKVTGIVITGSKLNIAKQVSLTANVPQKLQLIY
jgi:hypothetical protein